MINIICAMNKSFYIGKDGELLYKIKSDLKRFKELTIGSTVIMGHNTFKEIGIALPNRKNIVITKNPYVEYYDVNIYNDLELAIIDSIKNNEEVFIIGGEDIFRRGLFHADKVYLTEIQDHSKGDKVFPYFTMNTMFTLENESDIMEEDGVRFKFQEYIKK